MRGSYAVSVWPLVAVTSDHSTGLRPSTGYRIIIDSALLYESYPRLEVVIRSIDTTKCPGMGVLTMLTSPVDIVRVPRTDRPVVMHEKEVTNDCPKLK